MSAGLDLRQVRRAAERAVGSYAEHAALQREIAARLVERLDEIEDFLPARVLDVGCGPLGCSTALRARFPAAEFIGMDLVPRVVGAARAAADEPTAWLCGDAQALPFADASVDLVYSNLCFHWLDDPGLAMVEFLRVLRPGGLLLFSTVGPDTLKELHAAFAAADDLEHLSRFIDMHDIGDALLTSGYRNPVLTREDLTLTYPSALALMHELRALGVTHAGSARRRSLTGRHRFERALAAYDALRRNGAVPATFEAVYGQAHAPVWRLRSYSSDAAVRFADPAAPPD